MPDVSLTATLVATIVSFALGGVWYGPLFGKRWRALVGLPEAEVRRDAELVTAYGTTFLLALMASFVMGLFLGRHPGLAFSTATGAATGLVFVAGSLWTNDLFEGRRFTLSVINGGYHAVKFMLIGMAFGVLG
jgi:MFS family permease